MKVLVTGGSGFIGKCLVPRLQRHHSVHLLSADLTAHKEVREEVLHVNPALIVHLAARTEVEFSFGEPLDFSAINYLGTVNLIEAAKELSSLQLFLFSSTMETYGWQPESDEVIANGRVAQHRAFDERTPQHPNAPYAVAKLGCERYLEYAGRAYGLPWAALRQTNTYGRSSNSFFVVEQFITQMLREKEQVSFGDPRPYRNFLFVDDLLNLYETICNNPLPAQGHYFCTGPDAPIQIRELAAIVARHTKWNGEIRWGQRVQRPGEIFYLNSTPSKADALLDWRPQVSLEEGLERTVAIWKKGLEEHPAEQAPVQA